MENIAIWYRRFGEPREILRLEASLLPTVCPSLVRVRMIAAPINPSDLIPITGAYRHRVQPPQIAGYEGIGTVVAAEGQAATLTGRRVLPLRGPGTWQRYVDCDPAWMIVVPDDIDTMVAARGYINPLAVHMMLKRWPVRGKRVLLTAAGSCCANLLAQWARDAGAREVVGIYRSPERIGPLSELGVAPISMEASGEIMTAATKSDIVFDAVGGPLATSILNAMPAKAEFISYGLLSGQAYTAISAGARPQRFHLRDRLATTQADEWQAWFRELWALLRDATLPDVSPFPISAWEEALSLFERRGRTSKPILIME